MKRKSLPVARPTQTGLGQPTIMSRELAAAHGIEYVHLAVFCIDIDRVYWLNPDAPELPFGWEVFLTEYYVIHAQPSHELLAAACAELLEQSPGEPPLGGQLAFAVYDAAERGALPAELKQLFATWKSAPRDLLGELATLHAQAPERARQLATHCLNARLDPPLAPPTREALEKVLRGELRPSPAA
jgi:hypothetical protein